jgi:hypothetical protein
MYDGCLDAGLDILLGIGIKGLFDGMQHGSLPHPGLEILQTLGHQIHLGGIKILIGAVGQGNIEQRQIA